jgi:putative transposase
MPGARRVFWRRRPQISKPPEDATRWRKAMAQGLTSEQAAKAVGFPRSTLYRWHKRAAPLSRRPRRLRQPRRPEGLGAAVERLRLDHPMWGKEKLGPILRKQGYVTSNATVGRIIGALIRRGTVQPVPAL